MIDPRNLPEFWELMRALAKRTADQTWHTLHLQFRHENSMVWVDDLGLYETPELQEEPA